MSSATAHLRRVAQEKEDSRLPFEWQRCDTTNCQVASGDEIECDIRAATPDAPRPYRLRSSQGLASSISAQAAAAGSIMAKSGRYRAFRVTLMQECFRMITGPAAALRMEDISAIQAPIITSD